MRELFADNFPGVEVVLPQPMSVPHAAGDRREWAEYQMNRPTAFDTCTVQSSLADCARAHGVVGAGGGGYSLADKPLARPYQTLIINAAQSELLICKDWAARNCAVPMRTDGAVDDAFGPKKCFIAVREEFRPQPSGSPGRRAQKLASSSRLPDIYPLGYEKVLAEGVGIAPDSPAAQTVLVRTPKRCATWLTRPLRKRVTNKLITVAGAVAKRSLSGCRSARRLPSAWRWRAARRRPSSRLFTTRPRRRSGRSGAELGDGDDARLRRACRRRIR